MRHPTLDDRHTCTRSGPAAHQNPRAQPPSPPCSPPHLSTFTATIKLTESRAETLAKRRPWHYRVAWDTSVQKPRRLDARLMIASSSCAHVPALAAQEWGGRA